MILAKACGSPARPLLLTTSIMASSLDTVRVPFLSRTFTFLLKTSTNMVLRFFRPFGRPLGLPDWPGLNCRLTGGRLYPTARVGVPSDRFDSLMAELQRMAPRPPFRIAGLVGLEPGLYRRPPKTDPIGLSVAEFDFVAAPVTAFAFGCHGQGLCVRA